MAHDLIATRDAARRELCRRSLAYSFRTFWPVINPSTRLVWSWPLQLMCDRVQAHLERKTAKQNLYLGVPPGSAKSTIVSVMTLPWMWLKNPSYRAGFFSGNEQVAIRDSMYCREILRSDLYRDISQRTWDFASDENAKGQYRNTLGGMRYAASSGARVTGLRFHDIFVDDPEDAAEIYSDAYRYSINYEWWPAAANRLADMRTGRRTLIMQRLHEDDHAGHVMTNEPEDWDSLILRSTAEENDHEQDALDPRKPGELLFPERFPQTVLDGERVRLRGMYDAQHQQRPQPLGGGMLKPALMQICKIDGNSVLIDGVSHRVDWFITADIASSTKTSADNTAICVGGRLPDGRIVIRDVYAGRWEVPQTRQRLLDLWATGQIQYIGVETANAGLGIIQDLRAAGLAVKEMRADRDKVQRAGPLQIALDDRRIFRNEHAEWFGDAAHEMAQFPSGKHDDRVDSLAWMAIECASRPVYCGNSFTPDGDVAGTVPETYQERMERSFGD